MGINDVVGGALAVSLVANMWTGLTISAKNSDIEAIKASKAVCHSNLHLLEDRLRFQNDAVKKLEYNLSIAEERWNNRTPDIQYVTKWRTKYVEVNATCNDVINAISVHGF